MSAQPQLANPAPAPKLASLGTPQPASSNLNVVPANAYAHTIESGESLYTIARQPGGTELAGVCFSPDGTTLFLNAYFPGTTLAITGPWARFRA